jgi:hypothetical protein
VKVLVIRRTAVGRDRCLIAPPSCSASVHHDHLVLISPQPERLAWGSSDIYVPPVHALLRAPPLEGAWLGCAQPAPPRERQSKEHGLAAPSLRRRGSGSRLGTLCFSCRGKEPAFAGASHRTWARPTTLMP